MPKFMLCPIEGIDEFDTIEVAKANALDLMARVPECKGFVIYEVYEVGRFERVSPIWTEPSTDKIRKYKNKEAVNGQEDEIPF